MSRPLSDDERRAIDMRRLDEVLDAFVDTPLDQLDEAKFLEDLDRAMTPGNMRPSIEVPDEPVVRAPKRATHHEVGDAVDDDTDNEVSLLPSSHGDTLTGLAADDFPASAHDEGDHLGGALFDLDDDSDTDDAAAFDGGDESTTDTPGDATSDEPISGPEPDRSDRHATYGSAPSADSGLNLSSGLRDLLARRNQSSAPAAGEDVYGGATNFGEHSDHTAASESESVSTPPDSALRHKPAAATRALSPDSPDGTATTVLPHVDSDSHARANDIPSVPMRQGHDAKPSAIGIAREEMGSRLSALPPGRRKALKALAAFTVVGLVLMIVQSCLPEDNQTPTAAPPTTAAQQANPPTGSAEIPVPDRSDGVLSPSAVSARCPDGSTDARLALTADKSQAWICQRALGIDGAVLEMTFPKPVVVTDVFMIPGFDYVEPSGVDRWVEHRVVTRAQWTIGGQRFIQEINPSRAGANMTIPSVETNKITVTIMETAEPPGGNPGRGFGFATGKKDDSFAVSQIRITGHQP